MDITNTQQLKEVINSGKYTSIGSYPLFFYTAEGSALSFDWVEDNLEQCTSDIDEGWHCRIAGYDVNWEHLIYCDETGEQIESAYGVAD